MKKFYTKKEIETKCFWGIVMAVFIMFGWLMYYRYQQENQTQEAPSFKIVNETSENNFNKLSSLNEQIKELKNINQELTLNLEQKMQDLKQKDALLTNEKEQLKIKELQLSSINNNKEEKAKLQEEIKELKEKINQEKKELTDTINKLNTELENEKQKPPKEDLNKINFLTSEITRLQNELSTEQAKNIQDNSKINSLNADILNLQNDLKNEQTNKNKEITKLQNDLSTEQAKNIQDNTKINSLNADILKLQNDLKNEQNKPPKIETIQDETKIKDLTNQITNLNKIKDEKEKLEEELNNFKTSSTSEKQDLKDDIDKTTKTINEKENLIIQETNKLRNLQTTLQNTQDALKIRLQEIANLQKELQENKTLSVKDKNEKQQEIETLKKENKELKEKLTQEQKNIQTTIENINNKFRYDSSKLKGLNEVIGMDDEKEKIQPFLLRLNNPKAFEVSEQTPNLLLYGDPGTGKTYLAQALAKETKLPFYQLTSSDFANKYVGEGPKLVKEIFDTAKKEAPCIIFIDELEEAVSSRDGNTPKSSDSNNIVNAFLTQITDLDKQPKDKLVYLIGATNYKDKIDKAILDRFTNQIEVKYLNQEARLKFLQTKASKFGLNDLAQQYLTKISQSIENKNKSTRHLNNLFEKALDKKVIYQHNKIHCSDLLESFEEIYNEPKTKEFQNKRRLLEEKKPLCLLDEKQSLSEQIKQFRNNGMTIDELKEIGFKEEEIFKTDTTINFLGQKIYTVYDDDEAYPNRRIKKITYDNKTGNKDIIEIITPNIIEGYTKIIYKRHPENIKTIASLEHLESCDLVDKKIKDYDFISKIKKGLNSKKFTIKQLIETNTCTIKELIKSGVTLEEIINSGLSVGTLLNYGVTMEEIIYNQGI